jgi:hypothetical protein
MSSFRFKVAHSCQYGKYKKLRTKIRAMSDLLEYNEPLIREMLDLPPNINFVFRPLSRLLNGQYSFTTNRVSINAKLPVKYMMQVIFHELVHAEQYKTGRLRRELCNRKRKYVNIWNNQEMDLINFRKDYDKYRSLPWEMEAFTRETELLAEFLKKAKTP